MSKSEYKYVIVVVPDPELCISSRYHTYQCKASREGGQGYTVELNLNCVVPENIHTPPRRVTEFPRGRGV